MGTQNLATLLLTLSNLMFLPAIAVAVYRFYLVEASVYTYTMFFSTVGAASCPLTPPPELWECCTRISGAAHPGAPQGVSGIIGQALPWAHCNIQEC